MAGYSDDDRYPSLAELRQTLGTRAASYGVGFLIYGVLGLLSGELLGLDSIRVLHEHWMSVSIGFVAFGAVLIWIGWRHPN